MKDYSLIIIIPVYNTNPKKTELASLQQFSKVYNWKYDVRIICSDDFSDKEVVNYITLLNAPENVYVQYKRYDIHEIANVERKVPKQWIINDGTYVSDEFLKYARPLIIGELQPHYSGGVPAHITLK